MSSKTPMKWLALCLTLLICQTTYAESASKAGGRWVGTLGKKVIEMNAITLNPEEHYIAAEIVVAQPGCSGGVAGIGQVKDDQLTLTPYMPDKDFKACKVTVQFDHKGASATLSEVGCTDYHGASCTFSGEVRKAKTKE